MIKKVATMLHDYLLATIISILIIIATITTRFMLYRIFKSLSIDLKHIAIGVVIAIVVGVSLCLFKKALAVLVSAIISLALWVILSGIFGKACVFLGAGAAGMLISIPYVRNLVFGNKIKSN